MSTDPTLQAYDTFAPVYNEFNHLNNYEMWLGEVLLPELAKHGLTQGWVLDVGCGTGRAIPPLLRRGWEYYGCDLSPAMLDEARQEAGDHPIALTVADMRRLPVFGRFDLVISLNDAINYLLTIEDLRSALMGFRANLADDGLVLFDCTSRSTFETLFSTGSWDVEHAGRQWVWRGRGEVPGSQRIFESTIEGDDIDEIRLRERYWSISVMQRELERAGFRCRATLGMSEVEHRVQLNEIPDETVHYKIIYIAQGTF